MMQDCAGAILYSSDRAVEVAMEAQQCMVSPLSV
jgi:isovaleryl-CoA dehydrogenase